MVAFMALLIVTCYRRISFHSLVAFLRLVIAPSSLLLTFPPSSHTCRSLIIPLPGQFTYFISQRRLFETAYQSAKLRATACRKITIAVVLVGFLSLVVTCTITIVLFGLLESPTISLEPRHT
ncbi:hypothetical protein TRVL_08282 [Trypanosoma vivax]|nr:hypothetical protein TRVL_08282 [Trypanosoma vivax]